MSDHCKLYNEDYTDFEIKVRFNQSMMTVVDPTQRNDGFEMSMVEFYECIGRLAEPASLPPICKSEEETEEWDYEKRFALPLHIKMEAFIIRFIKYAVPKHMKDQYH